MILPLGDEGIASGLLCGFLFGYILENAGFGSPRKLAAQFELRDWTLFKVMFTAIVVAAAGLAAARWLGWMQAADLLVPTTYFWSTLLGGALVGAGFAIGGYCPGTAVVAFASGRFDGLVFFAGLVAGTLAFAYPYESLRGFMQAGGGPAEQTLPQLLGLPEWLILAALAAAAAAGYTLGGRFERSTRGPVTAAESMRNG